MNRGTNTSMSSLPLISFGCGNADLNPRLAPPPANSLTLPLSPLPPGVLFQESTEENPLLLGPRPLLAQRQQAQPPHHSSFFLPLHQFAGHHGGQPPQNLAPSPRKRPAVDSFPNSSAPELFHRRNQRRQLGFPGQLNNDLCCKRNEFMTNLMAKSNAKFKSLTTSGLNCTMWIDSMYYREGLK